MTPSFERRDTITDLTQVEEADRKINLTAITEMYQGPTTEAQVLGALAPQTVQAFEKMDNWYQFKSSWVGDAWIKVDAATNK